MIRYFFLLLVLTVCLSGNDLNAQRTPPSVTKEKLPKVIQETHLLLQAREGNYQRRVREGASVILRLKGDTARHEGQLRVYNQRGLYFAPFRKSQDTLLYDTIQNLKVTQEFVWVDSLMFITYQQIDTFAYCNRLERKAANNLLTFAFGTVTAAMPPLVHFSNGRQAEDFWAIGGTFSGVGLMVAGYGLWRLLRLKRYRHYAMSDYRLKVKI